MLDKHLVNMPVRHHYVMINIHMPLKQFKAKKVEHAQYTKVLDIEMQINTYFTSLFFITTRYNLAVKKVIIQGTKVTTTTIHTHNKVYILLFDDKARK